ncbi:Amine oxidase [Fusarium keratoplasticum]|nr:Amine oxidase [Fusarium keratoplasticum]
MVAPAHFVDVIIVGAGLSGLRAATELHSAGLSYVVLEAEDRVGGKTLSVPASSNGTGLVDMGAAWINDSNQSEIFALAEEFDFDLIVQRAEGNSLFQDEEGKVTSIEYGLPGALTDEQLKEAQALMAKLSEYVDRSDLQNPHLGPDAKRLDSLTALEFAEEEFGTDLSKMLVTTLTRAILGVDADELSALYLIDYVKSGTGLGNISSDLKDGGQYLRNRQGNQHFSTKLAEKLRKGSVKLSTPVTRIAQSSKGCTVETRNGQRFYSKKVIVSVPTSLYPLIEFQPQLPREKRELAKSTKLGYYSKTVLVFDSPWWREAGLSGVFTSPNGPIVFTRDTCVPEDEQYSITCFHVGEPGRKWSALPAQERQDSVLKQFNAAFSGVVDHIPKPISIVEKEWTKDHWFQGAPNPVMLPGTMTGAGKSIRTPFKNIHFIGTETAFVWKGYLEGAVRSGDRGAKEVIKALGKRTYSL